MKQRIQGFLFGALVMLAFGALATASNRITFLPSGTGGQHLSLAVHYTVLAQQEINRAVNVAASITSGGTTQANLEGSAEFGAAAGQGPTLYSAMIAMQTSLNSITPSQVGNLDQGN